MVIELLRIHHVLPGGATIHIYPWGEKLCNVDQCPNAWLDLLRCLWVGRGKGDGYV